uniref:Pre-mRNA-splicing factor SLU7 n=1 Tax=Ditylenchus dipsaci TaxID=166011 RepID=A0A915EAG4_9BILA
MSGTQQQVPVSMLIRQGQQLDDVDGKRRSKDEYRKQKDLEEQRKAGQAPAMVDIETGRDINPHIPEFIEKTPGMCPLVDLLLSINAHIQNENRNYRLSQNACENCGAMGHSKKTCLEKPRAIGAKYSNTNFAPDDNVLPSLKMGWDAKRDRWNGYDSAQYKQVHDEFERMEDARKMIKAQNIKDGIPDAEDEQKEKEAALEASKKDEADDEDKYADDMALCKGRHSKYLYNLDENGAHYDPKSRSMRENPFANMPGKEQEAAKFSGENFIRYTGEVVKANEAQVFAWTARCQGIDVHALAEPTKLEALKREYEKEKSSVKGGIKQDLVDKYGGQEYLANAPPKELLLAQTENYVEYNRKGKVVKGQERPAVKSRYDEDIFINNHTQVWGSYWKDNRWGYKCCHELTKIPTVWERKD